WSLAILGPGFFVGSWWLLSAAPLAAAVTHYRVVAGEERFLSERFGDEYESYRRTVRRWLWPLRR
ncbi:MAG: isoprenylcysteine carboxylmethyltransferase family protein, partial [Chloroflexi bacterium]|nr:isoprenylcysteine carboxylmethyltransferase family protein [Chloroflexota bacterium]